MANLFTLNAQELNYGTPPSVLTQDSIVFDGYSLQSSSFITTRIDYDNQGEIELNKFNFPRTNGGGVLSKYYRGRTITIKGTIKASTASAFNILIDDIKQGLRTTEGYLDITVNSEIRRIKATATKIDISRDHYNITFCPISVTFTAVEPFFYAITNQYLTTEAQTATFTDEMTHQGTAEIEPTIYAVFGVGTTATAMSFTDPDGRVLNIVSSITNGDVIIINATAKTVSKNGTEIDYTGLFPIFAPGSNNYTVAFTGTVLVDVTVTALKNYL